MTRRNREERILCSIGNGEATLVRNRDALQGSQQSTIATMPSLRIRYYNYQSYHRVQLVIHRERNPLFQLSARKDVSHQATMGRENASIRLGVRHCWFLVIADA